MSQPTAKFKPGDSVRVVDEPADYAELRDARGLTGEVYEGPDWYAYGNCWSYGVLVEGTEHSAIESDLEVA